MPPTISMPTEPNTAPMIIPVSVPFANPPESGAGVVGSAGVELVGGKLVTAFGDGGDAVTLVVVVVVAAGDGGETVTLVVAAGEGGGAVVLAAGEVSGAGDDIFRQKKKKKKGF